MKYSVLTIVSIFSLNINAGTINLNFDVTACEQALSDTLTPSIICSQISSGLDEAVAQDVPDIDLTNFSQDTSDSLALSSTGVSDYSDNFTYFVFKPSAGFAFTQPEGTNEDFSAGAGFSGSITVGLNMRMFGGNIGFIDLSRLDVFFNYFTFAVDQKIDQGNFTGETNSIGVMARYHLIPSYGAGGLFEWGGLSFHTGIQKSSAELTFSYPIEIDAGVTVQNETGNIKNSNFSFAIENDLTIIPIEVSTYFRFFYAFTVFTGVGTDIISGGTTMKGNAAGDLVLESRNNADLGDISYSESSSGDAQSGNFRGFIGGQLNLPFIRLYGQVQKPFSTNALGFSAGAKIVW